MSNLNHGSQGYRSSFYLQLPLKISNRTCISNITAITSLLTIFATLLQADLSKTQNTSISSGDRLKDLLKAVNRCRLAVYIKNGRNAKINSNDGVVLSLVHVQLCTDKGFFKTDSSYLQCKTSVVSLT